MNAIELIALEKLKMEVRSIIERADEKNEGRFQHERIFVLGDAKRAIAIIRALEDNSKSI